MSYMGERRFATPRAGRAAALTLAPGFGCGGAGSGAPNGDTETPAAARSSGDGQAGRAGQPLGQTPQVVVSKDGAAVAGRTVTWQIQIGGGSVNPAPVATGSDGLAATQVTLGNGGRM